MDVEETVDNCIKHLISEDKISLYERWAVEYKQRYYLNQKDVENKPKANSHYPGFESNFIALLWNILTAENLDPHGEWPYASQIDDSDEHVDIHARISTTELWFELGMYASSERAKYSSDFEKLKEIVNSSKANNVGILIHFEVFDKGIVSTIFSNYSKNKCIGIKVDFQEFKVKDKLILCRLILSKKSEII